MQTITLHQAVEFLENYSVGVIIPSANNLLIYPAVDLQNSPDNPFFHIHWVEDGLHYRIECFERDNYYPKFDGSSLYFIDEDGEELQVTLVAVAKISI